MNEDGESSGTGVQNLGATIGAGTFFSENLPVINMCTMPQLDLQNLILHLILVLIEEVPNLIYCQFSSVAKIQVFS